LTHTAHNKTHETKLKSTSTTAQLTMQYNAEKTTDDGATTQQQQQQSFMVKLAFGADEKRIVTLEQPSYDLLARKVSAALRLPAGSFALRYLDDEKDLITASSDEELQLALNCAAPSGVLRLQVVQLQAAAAVGEKRRKHEAIDDDVDPQAVALLVEHLREQHGREVKPKKCAKLLRKTGGDVALAQAAIGAWCTKRDAKDLKKREKKALKQQPKKKEKEKEHKKTKRGDDQVQRGEEEEELSLDDEEVEAPELKAKLDQLEAKGHAKRRKNAKLLFKCHGDVDKVLEVLEHKVARKEAKREWKRAKKSQKGDKKAHKREHKLERKGSKTAFKQFKKQHKREAKLHKQQYRLGYQELSVAPSSPMLTAA
jgi:hypothetical protein